MSVMICFDRNSAYGKTATAIEKHKDVSFCEDEKASRNVNSPFFFNLTPITPSVYEVEMKKRTIKFNLPHQIAFFVYQYAKLRMLEFYYDCVDYYIPRECFEYCQMDTDSGYISFCSDDFQSMVRPELKEEFAREKAKWFPRTDTKENAAYDLRLIGLFKQEFFGDGICALMSKTYYCWGDNTSPKFSCKGINKKHNKITRQTYLDVLREKKSQSGTNRGFRMHKQRMHTYVQKRDGFSYLYPKRKVLEDGVTTVPLDI